MRQTAVGLAVVAMVSWGMWVIFARLAGETLTGGTIVIVTYLVGGSIGIGYLVLQGTIPSFTRPGLMYAVVSGVFFGIGGLTYYIALQQGSTAVATTIAALYFVVATILAFVFLGEPLHGRDLVGIALAIGAVALLTT